LGSVLSSAEIRSLIGKSPPLIENFLDIEAQLQPNGFDLTLSEIRRYDGLGRIAISNSGRVLPGLVEIPPGDRSDIFLHPGAYHISYGETVNLPKDLMALGRPRSSLTRSGVTIHTAVWDAGYSGRSTSLLIVANPAGFQVEIGARVTQLVFIRLSMADDIGYRGIYQGENIRNK
jgi:dUTP diphosphatase